MAGSKVLSKMANKVNKKAKTPPKSKDTSGKRAYGDAELVSGTAKKKPKAKAKAKAKTMVKAKSKAMCKGKKK